MFVDLISVFVFKIIHFQERERELHISLIKIYKYTVSECIQGDVGIHEILHSFTRFRNIKSSKTTRRVELRTVPRPQYKKHFGTHWCEYCENFFCFCIFSIRTHHLNPTKTTATIDLYCYEDIPPS